MYYFICAKSPSSIMPVGYIIYHPGNAGGNWLPCDGRIVSRAAYPELFKAIGTGWGSPSSTTFNIPNIPQNMLEALVYQDFWETWPCVNCHKTFSNGHDRSTWWCQVDRNPHDHSIGNTYYPMDNLQYLEEKSHVW